MSFKNATNLNTEKRTLSSNYIYNANNAIPDTTWTKNPLWPDVTEPASDGSEDKFVGLYAVFFDRAIDGTGGLLSVRVATSSGTWTVNWGDGTSDSALTSNTAVEHEYNVNNTNLYDAAVTFTDAGDLVTRNGHHYTNGDIVYFYNIQSTTGVSQTIPYYVINATTNTFQVSTTRGGSAVALTTDGTASLLPYKVATVTITPDTGSTTTINPAYAHSAVSSVSYGFDWLDCVFSHPSATSVSMQIGSSGRVSYTLERIKVVACATQGFFDTPKALFNGLQALRVIDCPEDMYANTTEWSSAFAGTAIESAPYFNTSNATTMRDMFSGCKNLVSIPTYDTSNVTDMQNMFSGCVELLTVPYLNTSNVTNMHRMFYGCDELKSVPQALDTSNVTNMQQMFVNCPSLEKVQSNWNLSSCSNVIQMFSGCSSLKGDFVFTGCGSISSLQDMFYTASSINSVSFDGLSTALTTNGLYRTFNSCRSLKRVTMTNCNTSANTSCYQTFTNCTSLEELPEMSTSSVTNMQEMFYFCQSIATIPHYNTSNVTTMRSMFSNCTALKVLPSFDLTSCTNLRSFIQYCDLEASPELDTSSVTDFNSMVGGNRKLRIIPAYDMSSASNSTNTQMWGLNASLSRIKTTGMKYTFNISGTALNSAELDEVYSNLATVTGQTITVTNSRGVAGDNPSIATAKGWTVVG